MTENKIIPTLPVVDLLEMEMSRSEEVTFLIDQVRKFLNVVHKVVSIHVDEGNMIMVNEKLSTLSQMLPSASMAKAIAIKAFHKRKLELTVKYLSDEATKKLGPQMIKDLAKDGCYNEFALLTLAEETHSDISEQIGVFRSILSTHKAELEARVGFSQT